MTTLKFTQRLGQSFEIRKNYNYLLWSIALAILALGTDLTPRLLLHLPLTVHSESRAALGSVFRDPHLSLSGTWHISNLMHSPAKLRSVGAQAARIFLFSCAGLLFICRKERRLWQALACPAAALLGAAMFSQMLSIVLVGGVVHLLVHTTAAGGFFWALSLSDIYVCLALLLMSSSVFLIPASMAISAYSKPCVADQPTTGLGAP